MSASMHEFMTANRPEILELCVQKMKRSAGRTEAELAEGFDDFVDDVVRALQREAGMHVTSSLPGASEAASRLGGMRQSRGYPIWKLATDFGSLSDVIGQLASEKGVMFPAREYQVFNQCIDTSIAMALERFWTQSREQLANNEQERLGFLAHELRNALASARAAFAILRQGQLTALSRTGDVLDRALSRITMLIDQALTAVRLQGPIALTASKFVLQPFLQEVVESAVPDRGVTIRVEVDPALEANGDERLLHTAVGNLVHNALKFTRTHGHVVLRARADGTETVIEVEDECGGLPPGNENELFKPFVQKGKDRSGLGLGLAIAKDAVAAHGGEISVRNFPGKGCVFSIRLTN